MGGCVFGVVGEGIGALEVERYEKIWIALSLIVLVAFLAAISISVFAHGISLPGVEHRFNPNAVFQKAPFDKPGVTEVGPGQYEVHMVGMVWRFVPNRIRVPVGSKVTIHATSRDVTHGLTIQGTNLNLMLLPGLISTGTATFNEPGEYLFLCHEYCGIAHQVMAGKVIVEASPK